jgi:1-deoxy-D-xylulose-5-phosphate synthase
VGLLDAMTGPAAVKKLDSRQLAELAAEMRAVITETVGRNGGHLGSNLGAVEITLALHRVYDSPHDRILFDTGHQAYAHKLLTGRHARFPALRKAGGLSGYPSRAESEHDLVENSHASVALSYAEGLTRAFRQRDEPDRAVVAVVGDGALTGGVAWEAVNNIGASGLPLVIVLNDNGRSYSPTVGGLAQHLAELRGTDCRQFSGQRAAPPPALRTVFETLGFGYLGAVDGHDEAAVEDALRTARASGRPVVVHCVTSKGRGYPPAENDPEECLHSPGRFDPKSGRRTDSQGRTWTRVFGEEVAALGGERPDLVAITAAMLYPTGLDMFAGRHPERIFDVGIAEQHAVALAAGLAFGGLRPVVALYSTFLNRAFDQVLLDVALHRLPVTFVLDRAGITGDDGPSHHGVWDLALLGMVPGLRVAAPRDGARLRELLREAVGTTDGPTAVRFPKGALGPDIPALARVGGADVLARHGAEEALLLAVGPTAAAAVEAAALLTAQGAGATVLDPRWVKPLSPEVLDIASRHRAVLVIEDGIESGGIGDALRRGLARRRAAGDGGAARPVGVAGVPARFIPHDTRDSILAMLGLADPARLARLALWLIGLADGTAAGAAEIAPAAASGLALSLAWTLSGGTGED